MAGWDTGVRIARQENPDTTENASEGGRRDRSGEDGPAEGRDPDARRYANPPLLTLSNRHETVSG
jgi:hypothetical protein